MIWIGCAILIAVIIASSLSDGASKGAQRRSYIVTDRVNGFWVALGENVRTDDARPLMDAILQLKGVIAVTPNPTSDSVTWVAEERVRLELRLKILDVLK